MECNAPGAIRDEELLAYLAGEKVQPFVAEHLAHCQRCSAQLATYRELENLLTSKLYRWDCPPSQVLGEYELGVLSREMTAAVRHHLSICTLCAVEVKALAGFLADDPALEEQAIPARIPVQAGQNNHTALGLKQAIDRLREQSGTGMRRVIATLIPPQPRLAFQRDGLKTGLWPRNYSAEDVNISLQVEQDTRNRNRLQLIGLIKRKGQALGMLEGTQVLLSSQQNEAARVQSERIDELGNFVFSAIAPDTYTLELQFPETVIVIDQLPIDPQH